MAPESLRPLRLPPEVREEVRRGRLSAGHAKVILGLPQPEQQKLAAFLVLRDGILDGRYRYGDVLPSEHELAGRYGVSRITAKHAADAFAEPAL